MGVRGECAPRVPVVPLSKPVSTALRFFVAWNRKQSGLAAAPLSPMTARGYVFLGKRGEVPGWLMRTAAPRTELPLHKDSHSGFTARRPSRIPCENPPAGCSHRDRLLAWLWRHLDQIHAQDAARCVARVDLSERERGVVHGGTPKVESSAKPRATLPSARRRRYPKEYNDLQATVIRERRPELYGVPSIGEVKGDAYGVRRLSDPPDCENHSLPDLRIE